MSDSLEPVDQKPEAHQCQVGATVSRWLPPVSCGLAGRSG